MEVENDFIKRETNKLILLLNNLIEKINGLNSSNSKSVIEEVNEFLRSQFSLSLDTITEIETSEFIRHISELHESHTEKIAQLIYETTIKTESIDLSEKYKKSKIAQKGIIIIDFLNDKSKTFPIRRMYMKKALQNFV